MEAITTLRSERFEVSFNKIHNQLKKLVKNEAPNFSGLVYKGSKRFSLIQNYQEELIQFGRLRNAIVHDRYDIEKYIAEPNEETVQRIEKISEIFSKPNNALSIATKDVISYDFEDSIETVIQGINQHSYSQYPIYRNGECIGLLTAKAVVRWMASHVADSIVNLAEIRLIDVFDSEADYPLSFAPKSTNIFDVEEIFERAHRDKQDLEAVIITENGQKSETPLGVITPWDIIEIDYTLD